MSTNVTLSVSNTIITASTTTDTVNVTTATSNIVVGTTPVVENSVIRGAISATDPVAYNSSTGVISVNNTTLLSGQTSDNLTQGSNNIFFSTSGAAINTTNLSEGTNLYFTDARARAAISNASPVLYNSSTGEISLDSTAVFAGKDTDDLPEGSNNLYFTASRFNSQFGTRSTSDLTEGSNLYFTTGRARAAISGGDQILRYNSSTGVFTESNQDGHLTNGTSFTNPATFGTIFLTGSAGASSLTAVGNIGAEIGFLQLSAGSVTGPILSRNGNIVNITGGISTPTISGLTGNISTTGTVIAGSLESNSVTPPSGTFTVSGEGSITGNLVVGGNIDYTHVNDLFVANNEIIMNANASTDTNVTITVNRPQGGTNAHLRWNETADYWEIFDASNTFIIPRSTDDLAQGSTNKYVNGATTSDLAEGTNLYFTPARLQNLDTDISFVNGSSGGNLIYNSTQNVSATQSNISSTVGSTSGTNIFKVELGKGTGGLLANGSQSVFDYVSVIGRDETQYGFTFQNNASIKESHLINHVENVYTGNNNATSRTHFISFNRDLADGSDTLTSGFWALEASKSNTTSDAGFIKYSYADEAWFFGNTGVGSTGTRIPVTTTDLSEGSNLYYTNARVDAYINASIDTDDVSEGSTNQYFTTARANSAIGAYTGTLTNLTGNVTTTANVSASHFIGSGTALTGVVPEALDTGKILLGSTSNTAIGVTPNSNFVTGSNAFNIANNITGLNTINTESGSNITLDTNTGKSIAIRKDQGATTDVPGLFIESDGYSARSRLSLPVYGGTANLTSFVATGNATAGSPNIVLSAGCEFINFKTANTFGNAATLTTLLSSVSTNMVLRSGSITSVTQAPFPAGTKVLSVDAGNNIITMTQNASSNASFEQLPATNWSSSTNKLAFFTHGFYDDDTGHVESYMSEYDFNASASRSTISSTSGGTFANFFNPVTVNRYGYGASGPTLSDLTSTFNDNANVSSIGSYAVDARTTLQNDKGWAAFEDGILIGNASPTARMTGDFDVLPGINQLWDGTKVWGNTTWYNNPTFQFGMRQFSDNSAQSNNKHLGPRMFMVSSNGNAGDSEFDWYPRAGQELGRFTFWGTLGTDPNPPQTIPPAYISVQASDDWDNGSNCSMYFQATSAYANSSSSRDQFLAYHRGNMIIASGQSSNVTSQNAGITFAPARTVGANPQDAYDFAGNSQTTQMQTFGRVNYANISANSGAKISVTHGASSGAGTVGDQVVEIRRFDNTLTGTQTVNDTRYLMNAAFSNSALQLADFGLPVSDCIRVNTGNSDTVNGLLGLPVTFSGITDSNWTHYNGNTFVLRTIGFAPFFAVFDSANANPIVSSGTSNLSGAGATVASMEFNTSVSSGVTNSKYEFVLPEQESNLYIKNDDFTSVKITGNTEVNFTAIPTLPSHSNTSLPSAGTAGGMIYVTNGNNKPAYSNGSAWLYFFDNSAVT